MIFKILPHFFPLSPTSMKKITVFFLIGQVKNQKFFKNLKLFWKALPYYFEGHLPKKL